jgi:hypothetical protein
MRVSHPCQELWVAFHSHVTRQRKFHLSHRRSGRVLGGACCGDGGIFRHAGSHKTPHQIAHLV